MINRLLNLIGFGLAVCVVCSMGCRNPFSPQAESIAKATLSESDAKRLVAAETKTSAFRWTNDYGQALEQASSENKVVMALFTGSDWCTYCTKLEKEVFAKPEFNDWANQQFVPLMVDFPRNKKLAQDIEIQNEQLKEKYAKYIGGYPTVLFIDPAGQVVGKMGYARGGAQDWIAAAERQIKPALDAIAVRQKATPADIEVSTGEPAKPLTGSTRGF
jgi:protein disulfide-isomerase